ncbi:hypothetical protein ACVIHH_006651 [Bradyrhizobium sp. USDA 4518]|nr:hypothetical protein [Bradyrhizobium sp. USDA 4545]MCP1847225.1 hypothetical protein [Bradyrhizobium sp. USDA 4541]MCP1911128.1 hypothetical protein [Bradyrhizobium elkanii]MCP1921814.1 hypothetical protein [Bradyrhizobium sp. USDA 4532]
MAAAKAVRPLPERAGLSQAIGRDDVEALKKDANDICTQG